MELGIPEADGITLVMTGVETSDFEQADKNAKSPSANGRMYLTNQTSPC